MEVILKKDFVSLGYEGDICKVKDGYARNYLIPRNIAVIKNAANLRTLEQMQKSLEKKRAKRKMEAEILKGKIVDISVVIPVKVAENGKLYGSVSQQSIVDALKEKEIEISKRDVHMEKHIKELGEYEVEIKLYHSVNANIKINVVNMDADIDKKAEKAEKAEESENAEKSEEENLENEKTEIIAAETADAEI